MTDESEEIREAFAEHEAREPRPITCGEAARRYGPGTIAARERYEELSTRHALAAAYAKLRATGQYDPARRGAGDTEPLTTDEHLELIATGEYLSRAYRPSFEVDRALVAGATWPQVAAALDADEAAARVAYRKWADRQHDMLTWTEGRIGMSDAEHAAAMRRVAYGAELDGGFGKEAGQ